MRSLGAAALVGLLVCLLAGYDFFEPLDEGLFGAWLRQRNQGLSQGDLAPMNAELVLVTLDGPTVAEWGATLPPDVWCEAVRRLKRAGCTTIGLNTLFLDPMPDPLADDLRQSLADPAVVMQCPLEVKQGRLVQVLPHPTLLQGWTPPRLGFTAAVGTSGQIRAVWLQVTQDKQSFYSWPVALLAHHLQISPEKVLVPIEGARHETHIHGERESLTVQALEAWPNFPAPGTDTSHNLDTLLTEVSLKQLLELSEKELDEMFGTQRRRIALVGPVESGSARVFQTLAGKLSGMEINAVTVVNLARHNFLLPERPIEEYLLILGTAFVVGLVAGRRLLWGGLVTLGMLPGLLLLSYSWLAVPHFGPSRLLPVTGALASGCLSLAVAALLQRLEGQRRRQHRVVEAFRRFSPCGPLEGQPVLLRVDLRPLIRCSDDLGQTWICVAEFAGEVASTLERFGGRLVETRGGVLQVAFGLEPRSRAEKELAAVGAGATIVSEFSTRAPQWLDAGAAGQTLTVLVGLRSAPRGLPRRALVLSEEVRQKVPPLVRSNPLSGGHLVAVEETLTGVKLEGPWHPDLQLGPSQAALNIGDMLGPYRIESFVGQGGMGAVYRALDTRLLRKVAVKVLMGALDAHDNERFLAEARAVARVQHIGIVAIHAVEVTPIPFIAMEFAAGVTLREVMEAGPLDPSRAVGLAGQILEALKAVHGHGVIHRDLKPANIMVDPQDGIKLMDFGLARILEDDRRLTKQGDICGTPEYMGPEHLDERFGEVDEVTDLFAMGTILYEMLTGDLPMRGTGVGAMMHELLHVDAPLVKGVDPRLAGVVARALKKRKKERFQSAQEFLDALRHL